MKDLVIRDKGNQIRFKFLKWDTTFFGVKSYSLDMAGLVINRNRREFADMVVNSLGPSFVVAKVPHACHRSIVDFLLDLNFRYINTEIILKFVDNKDSNDDFLYKVLPGVVIEKATDVPPDAYLLGKEFSLSRFHLDKNIAKKTADSVWVEYIRNFKLNARHHLFIARIKNKTIGAILVNQYMKNGKKVSNLFSVSLRRNYRGRNTGSALLRYTIDWCKQHSEMVLVETQSNNIKALNFYIKNNFSKIQETRLILHKRKL